ncbi:hypothetical protein SODG_005919 [Sodalis praecaptivus]
MWSVNGQWCQKSISRASRALTTLEELGAIKCERVWDDSTHSYIPKIIWVTELFFVLIDYELGNSCRHRASSWPGKTRSCVSKAKAPSP